MTEESLREPGQCPVCGAPWGIGRRFYMRQAFRRCRCRLAEHGGHSVYECAVERCPGEVVGGRGCEGNPEAARAIHTRPDLPPSAARERPQEGPGDAKSPGRGDPTGAPGETL